MVDAGRDLLDMDTGNERKSPAMRGLLLLLLLPFAVIPGSAQSAVVQSSKPSALANRRACNGEFGVFMKITAVEGAASCRADTARSTTLPQRSVNIVQCEISRWCALRA